MPCALHIMYIHVRTAIVWIKFVNHHNGPHKYTIHHQSLVHAQLILVGIKNMHTCIKQTRAAFQEMFFLLIGMIVHNCAV